MFGLRKSEPNSEKLFDDVDKPPNLDFLILNLQSRTSKIHASYLFEPIGRKILQKLCLLLSSTATGKVYKGWQEFAACLGITPEQIQCINYDFKGLQDSTYYVLLSYIQIPDATLDKILITLQEISRFDIINRIKDDVDDLVNNLKEKIFEGICKPTIIPRAPLVLNPLNLIEHEVSNVQTKVLCKLNDTKDNEYKAKPNYASVVMLTFAKDGLNMANRLAKILRNKQPKIGVLILEEQKKHLFSKGEEFIDDCFKQVNYIIPLLSNEYIQSVTYTSNSSIDMHDNLDSKYLKYIYSLLRYEYIKNNCCNNRVRCIVPNEDIKTIINSDLHPTLQAWFRENDIDEFIDNVILQKC